jgi:transketolase
VAAAAAHTRRLVVAEEHHVRSGLFGAVSEIVVQRQPVPILPLCVPSVFAPIGPAPFLLEHFGLTPVALADRIAAWVEGFPVGSGDQLVSRS